MSDLVGNPEDRFSHNEALKNLTHSKNEGDSALLHHNTGVKAGYSATCVSTQLG